MGQIVYTELQMTARKNLTQFALAVFGTSCFFWSWAVWNIVSGKVPFDLGVVSFASSAMSSFYLYQVAKLEKRQISSVGKCITLSTFIAVSINYALGALIGIRNAWVQFSVYCIAFTILWIAITLMGNSLIRSYHLLND